MYIIVCRSFGRKRIALERHGLFSASSASASSALFLFIRSRHKSFWTCRTWDGSATHKKLLETPDNIAPRQRIGKVTASHAPSFGEAIHPALRRKGEDFIADAPPGPKISRQGCGMV